MTADEDPRAAAPAYQALLLHHVKEPLAYGPSLPGSREHTEVNALCGDAVTVGLRWSLAHAAELRFTCVACSLCKASASLLMAAATGQRIDDLRTFVALFQSTLPLPSPPPPSFAQSDLAALYELRRYASRQRCVLLPWDALAKLLYS